MRGEVDRLTVDNGNAVGDRAFGCHRLPVDEWRFAFEQERTVGGVARPHTNPHIALHGEDEVAVYFHIANQVEGLEEAVGFYPVNPIGADVFKPRVNALVQVVVDVAYRPRAGDDDAVGGTRMTRIERIHTDFSFPLSRSGVCAPTAAPLSYGVPPHCPHRLSASARVSICRTRCFHRDPRQ